VKVVKVVNGLDIKGFFVHNLPKRGCEGCEVGCEVAIGCKMQFNYT
jgi:hypothetical protein